MHELDAIIGAKISVLDDGFVRVVDYMGNDAAIVQAAGAGTKTRSDNAIQIRYVLRHRIMDRPFESCLIKLHLRMPMDCWIQWVSWPDRRQAPGFVDYSHPHRELLDCQSAQPVPLPGHPRR